MKTHGIADFALASGPELSSIMLLQLAPCIGSSENATV